MTHLEYPIAKKKNQELILYFVLYVAIENRGRTRKGTLCATYLERANAISFHEQHT